MGTTPPIIPFTSLRDMLDPARVQERASRIQPTPEQAQALAQVAGAYLKSHPGLANLPIVFQQTPQVGAYLMGQTPGGDPDNNLRGVVLGKPSPAVLAHELGHAQNLQDATVYRTFIEAARGVAGVANALGVPAAIALRLLVADKARRDEALNLLTGLTAAVNAPILTEELGASLNALKEAPNKWETLKELGPAFLSYVTQAAVPIASLQLARLI